MKKHVTLFFLCLNLFSQAQEKPTNGKFTLIGQVSGRDTGRIILTYLGQHRIFHQDTTFIKRGKFVFTGFIDGTCFAHIFNSEQNYKNYAGIFIEPADMTILLADKDFKHPTVTGSKTQVSMDSINRETEIIDAKISLADNEIKRLKDIKGDLSTTISDSINSANAEVSKYQKKKASIYESYVRKHPHADLSAGIMQKFMLIGNMPIDTVMRLYNGLDSTVRNNPMAKIIYENLQTTLKTNQSYTPGGIASVGIKAPLFKHEDINGKLLALGDYKGKKYVLLDFWASWCGPCRALPPFYTKIYKEYAGKRLEIISISLDDNINSWKTAVTKDGINKWRNIAVGNDETKSEILKNYNVQTIPTAILIDMDGNIIYRSMKMGELMDLTNQMRSFIK